MSTIRWTLSVLVALTLALLTLPQASQVAAAPNKRIVVSIANQRLDAYENGTLVLSTPVTTGRPEMPTPRGTFFIRAEISPMRFVSLYPPGSPYYYAPITASYSLQFLDHYYLHDAPWRASFGPGTNTWHTDAWGRRRTGSLGCVNVPGGAMARLYRWATVGTEVTIR
ncbi:MAG: L,D-transpeptidase [Chloroflexi bacterium]|nr:L,D-transpeptidase [Chloroflexota bacterium]